VPLLFHHSTFDQYSTIVLANCIERHIVGNHYCDEPLGLHIIRGDSIILLAPLRSLKMDGKAANGQRYTSISLKEILEMKKNELKLLKKTNNNTNFDDFYNFS
jgi:U6 snRNA-associated Sm-like protein LSm1